MATQTDLDEQVSADGTPWRGPFNGEKGILVQGDWGAATQINVTVAFANNDPDPAPIAPSSASERAVAKVLTPDDAESAFRLDIGNARYFISYQIVGADGATDLTIVED